MRIKSLARKIANDIEDTLELKKEVNNVLDKAIISSKNLTNKSSVAQIAAINISALIVEIILHYPKAKKFLKAYAVAEEEYMPSYPPISPITNTMFTIWISFDLTLSPKSKETASNSMIYFKNKLGIPEYVLDEAKKLSDNRLGFYIQEEIEESIVYIREILTNKKMKVIFSSNYKGKKGEVCLCRFSYESKEGLAIGLITPYTLQDQSEQDILDYYERQNIKQGDIDIDQKLNKLFKDRSYGDTYWLEYVFQGYVGFDNFQIKIRGIPDIKKSLPHG